MRTTCNRDCPDGCGIVATVEDGRVVSLQGDPDHPVTRGFLCYRTHQFLSRQYADDRITQPLLRREKGGELLPVSWDEALDVIANKLQRVREESGAEAILSYRGGGSLGWLKVVTDLFFERFGPCAAVRGDICAGAGSYAQEKDFGLSDSNDLFDLDNARSILLWGKNVYTSSPHNLPVLQRARRRGAQLTLIDPVHHRSAGLCERFVQPRPGGDFALAMATAALLVNRGALHPDAGSWCANLEEHLALVGSRDVAAWAAQADVGLDDVAHLADALSTGAPCTLLVGWGMQRSAHGAAIVRALDALGAITGNVGVPGAGVSFYWARRRAADFSFLEGLPAAPRSVCEPTLGRDLRDAAPAYRFAWISAANPVAMLPESDVTAQALRDTEMVVVVDQRLTDTARCADVVLPTTTLLEDDDVMGAYGHHYLAVSRPVVPPPAGVRTDLEIVQALAQRVGIGDEVAGTPREWKRRIAEPRLAEHGITLEDLEAGPVRSPVAPHIVFSGRQFATADGKAHLLTLADAPPPPAERDSRWPLRLLTVSTPESQSSQWAHPPSGSAVVTVHPDASAGVADGGRGRLEGEVGSMDVVVHHDARQRTDLVLVPKGGHVQTGRCANRLIRARLTDHGEGAALHEEHVRLVPADPITV